MSELGGGLYAELARKAVDSGGAVFSMDVDGTTASYLENPPDSELEARREIREIAETHGAYVLSTARTPELCMSESMLMASREAGFTRLDPKCYVGENGMREYRPLSTIRKYAHLDDPDAINSVGEGIWVKRDGVFRPDTGYYSRYSVDRETWKNSVHLLLDVVDSDRVIRNGFSELEDPDSHASGKVDVQELGCRFEVTAKPGVDGRAWKRLVRERLHYYRNKKDLQPEEESYARISRSIDFIDESVPNRGRYQLYIVPHKRLTKEGAFNHILGQISQESGVPTSEFISFTSGDRIPDLKAGLFGGNRGYFVLPGGSVLTEYLVGNKKGQDFAGQSLASIVRRLRPIEGRPGWYLFKMFGMTHERVVIIADQATKGGKTDAESVLEVLKQINGKLLNASAL